MFPITRQVIETKTETVQGLEVVIMTLACGHTKSLSKEKFEKLTKFYGQSLTVSCPACAFAREELGIRL